MAKTPFDVNERDRLRAAYLKALYEQEQREKVNVGTILCTHMAEAARTLGITELKIERITTDLENAGLIRAMGGMRYALTDLGRGMIEDHLHEEHRPWHDKMKEKAASPAVVGGIAGFIAALIVSLLAASDIPWWVKLMIGKK